MSQEGVDLIFGELDSEELEKIQKKIQEIMTQDHTTVPVIKNGKIGYVDFSREGIKLSIDQLHKNIVQWAHDRNLVEGATPATQMLKMVEELGELAGGIAKNRPEVIKDSIGDVFVVLTILAEQCGMDMQESIQQAWDEIKDRKGKLINGVFVKESDLDG